MKLPAKHRVLCVEDDHDTCEMLRVLFGMEGFDFVPAGSIAEGLAEAKSQSFDLILLNEGLPDGSGIELCRQVREFDHDTPIIFVSGADAEVDRERALEAGAQAFVPKPYEFEPLLDQIVKLIEASGSKSEGGSHPQ